jgi:ABC-type branched-subunit amino acid transport system ATPase component
VLLDEPAAGLPDEETSHLAEVIKRIPEHTGALAILEQQMVVLAQALISEPRYLLIEQFALGLRSIVRLHDQYLFRGPHRVDRAADPRRHRRRR